MYRLRELERKDISTINAWRNDPKLIEQLGAPFRYINDEVDNAWFDGYMSNRNNCVRCAIIQVESPDEIIGLISLTNIDMTNQSAALHILIGDTSNQGNGAGTFAIETILQHAFQNMNIHRVELRVLLSNKRAQHVYEKCGFVKEGIVRKAIFKNGKFEDMLLFAILREEYKGPVEKQS